MNRINPIPIEARQQSYIPSNSAVEPVNNMMYLMDAGVGKTVGLKYDPPLLVAWNTNQTTLTFSLIGLADQRVLVGSNIHPRYYHLSNGEYSSCLPEHSATSIITSLNPIIVRVKLI